MDIFSLSNHTVLDAINKPLLRFDYLKYNIDFDKYDLYIFTSQNAIKAISTDIHKIKNKKIITVGNKTKDLLKQYDIRNILTPNTHNAINIINQYKELIKKNKSLYIRGERISTDISDILKIDNITLNETIVYKSYCNDIQNITKNSWVILSSPFMIECFQNNFDLKDYKIMLLSQKLSSYLPTNIDYKISPSISIQKAISYIKSIS
jgi:uroporphyrinogen-III synthase